MNEPHDWQWRVNGVHYKIGLHGRLFFWGSAQNEWFRSSMSVNDVEITYHTERNRELLERIAENKKKRREIRKGEEFGFWTVLDVPKSDNWTVKCECDCGTVKNVNRTALLRGASISCGCQQNPKMADAANTRWESAA